MGCLVAWQADGTNCLDIWAGRWEILKNVAVSSNAVNFWTNQDVKYRDKIKTWKSMMFVIYCLSQI